VHKDCGAFGWVLENKGHDWSKMVDNIQDHIHGLNFNYRVELRDKNVTYLNMLGTFKDAHTLECTNPRKPTQTITAKRFVVAVGGRPKPLDCPGGELAISSDDIFSMQKSPGKTLVIGASYVALECAGFMAGIGLDVTVMVRSILLRGFDTQCADMIGEFMQKEGCKFIRGSVPSKLEKGADGRITCFWESNGETKTDVYDTVLVAIGRDADVSLLGLEALGVEQDKWSKKIVAPNEQTSVQNIYAIGDVVQDCPELTPVAIQAGKMLAKRIAGVSDQAMDYSKVRVLQCCQSVPHRRPGLLQGWE
jgi:thioredoxin reductase (NADPH)